MDGEREGREGRMVRQRREAGPYMLTMKAVMVIVIVVVIGE